jgi:hypothetical protein
MASNLVWMNGFEFAGDNTQWSQATPSWAYQETYGAVTMNSTTQSHQPIGKSAPFAGSRALRLETTDDSVWSGPDVWARVNAIGTASGFPSTQSGRLVWSHYHDANIWGPGANYGNQDKRLFLLDYSNPTAQTNSCQINWNEDRTLNFYVTGVYKETTTVQIPDASWTRIGVVWASETVNTGHDNFGAQLYVNGTPATAWYNYEDNSGNTWKGSSEQINLTFSGSTANGSTYVDHLVVTNSTTIDAAPGGSQGGHTDTGKYSNTQEWQVIIPVMRPNADVGSFNTGNFTASNGGNGGNWDRLNEVPPSNTNFTESQTDPSSFGCAFDNLDATYSNEPVMGVQLTVACRGDGSMATSDVQIAGNASGNPGLGAAKSFLLANISTVKSMTEETDPSANQDWDIAKVNDAGFKYTTT